MKRLAIHLRNKVCNIYNIIDRMNSQTKRRLEKAEKFLVIRTRKTLAEIWGEKTEENGNP